ncbi:hypothetical protein ACOJR9_15120 [Alteromonas sp. A081]|uniref:hypothetical protein n=1 Tax=Alteromonas sp. A081 TaxID=3410269 RepID=UPI003B986B42
MKIKSSAHRFIAHVSYAKRRFIELLSFALLSSQPLVNKRTLIQYPVFKNAIACAALLLGSASVHADTIATEQEKVQKTAQKTETLGKPNTTPCPNEFHSIVLSSDATQCQQFESETPAAMVYHTALTPSQVVSFYKERFPLFKTHPAINQRTLITSKERNTKIVVSPDNAGAQVDILVAAK